jgi:hypothetical protein
MDATTTDLEHDSSREAGSTMLRNLRMELPDQDLGTLRQHMRGFAPDAR